MWTTLLVSYSNKAVERALQKPAIFLRVPVTGSEAKWNTQYWLGYKADVVLRSRENHAPADAENSSFYDISTCSATNICGIPEKDMIIGESLSNEFSSGWTWVSFYSVYQSPDRSLYGR